MVPNLHSLPCTVRCAAGNFCLEPPTVRVLARCKYDSGSGLQRSLQDWAKCQMLRLMLGPHCCARTLTTLLCTLQSRQQHGCPYLLQMMLIRGATAAVVAFCTAGSGSGPLEGHVPGSAASGESQEDAGQWPPGNEAVAGWDGMGGGDSPPSKHLARGPARRRKSRLSACSYADEAGAWQPPAARVPVLGLLSEGLQLQQTARSAPATVRVPQEEGQQQVASAVHRHLAAGEQRLGSAAAGSLSVPGDSQQASFPGSSCPAEDKISLLPDATRGVTGQSAPAALMVHAAEQPASGACSPPAADGTLQQQPGEAQGSAAAIDAAAGPASSEACSLPTPDGAYMQPPADVQGSTAPAASPGSGRPPVVSPFASAARQASLPSDGGQAALQPSSRESGSSEHGPRRLPAIRITSSLPAASTYTNSPHQAAEEQAGAGSLMASSAGSCAHPGSSMDRSTTAGIWLGAASEQQKLVPSAPPDAAHEAHLLRDSDRLSPRSSSVQPPAAAPAAVTMWSPKKADSAPGVIDCGALRAHCHDWEDLWHMQSNTRRFHLLLVAQGVQ